MKWAPCGPVKHYSDQTLSQAFSQSERWFWWKLRCHLMIGLRQRPIAVIIEDPGLLGKSMWYDDVIKWKKIPRNWPFVRGIHRSPVNSLHKGKWRGALVFSLICASINGWVNNREAGDLRPYRAHYDVIVMKLGCKLTYRGLTRHMTMLDLQCFK